MNSWNVSGADLEIFLQYLLLKKKKILLQAGLDEVETRKISQYFLSLTLSAAKICPQGQTQGGKHKNGCLEGLVQDLSSAGMCCAASTH